MKHIAHYDKSAAVFMGHIVPAPVRRKYVTENDNNIKQDLEITNFKKNIQSHH